MIPSLVAPEVPSKEYPGETRRCLCWGRDIGVPEAWVPKVDKSALLDLRQEGAGGLDSWVRTRGLDTQV